MFSFSSQFFYQYCCSRLGDFAEDLTRILHKVCVIIHCYISTIINKSYLLGKSTANGLYFKASK